MWSEGCGVQSKLYDTEQVIWDMNEEDKTLSDVCLGYKVFGYRLKSF